jgi:prepilin-type N-terminal cleavage/methylation domain-containing protein
MSRRRGFTLVEMLVTIVLVSVALVAVFQGIARISATEAKARQADLLQRLAYQKISELGSVTDPRTSDSSGDFTDQGYPDVSWSIDVETTGTTTVQQVTVTATRGNDEQKLTGMIYLRPLTSTGGTTP